MFGKQFRNQHFLFDSDVVPVNHGSYGAVPKRVYNTYKKAIANDLSFPDKFMFEDQAAGMEKSVRLTAGLLNTDFHNIALVPNASSGTNIVLREFPFQEGDTIVISSLIYGACGNTVDYVANRFKLNVTKIDISFPVTESEILAKFETAFKDSKGTTMAVYDTICSMPGVRLPFEKITELCKKYSIVSCIDGAHSIGMIPIDIAALGCDFYTSNLHKWLYVPRGCAVLYAAPKWQDLIFPFPISHSYKADPFYKRFLFYASSNYSAFYCVEEALKFVEEDCGGFDKLREYCGGMANKLRAHFGKDRLIEVSDCDALNFLVTVKVPLAADQKAFFATKFKDPGFFEELRSAIVTKLFDDKHTYVQFGFLQGEIFVRLSCQVYIEYEELLWGYQAFVDELQSFYAKNSK